MMYCMSYEEFGTTVSHYSSDSKHVEEHARKLCESGKHVDVYIKIYSFIPHVMAEKKWDDYDNGEKKAVDK